MRKKHVFTGFLLVILFIIGSITGAKAQCSANAGVDTSICKGLRFTRTALYTPVAASVKWYQVGNATAVSNTATIDLVMNTAGTFRYAVEVSSTTCATPEYDTVTVTVNETSANAGRDSTICQGKSFTRTASVDGSLIQWFSQTNRTTILSNTSTLNISTPAVGDQIYIVKVSIPGTVACDALDSFKLSVLPNQVTAGNDTTICQGQPFVRTATVNASTGVATTWFLLTSSSNILSNAAAISHTAINAGTYNYVVRIVSGSIACNDRDTVKVTVNPKPSVNAGSDETVCQGSPLTLTATITPSNGVIKWTKLGTTTSLSTTTEFQVPTATAGITSYEVKVDSASTCSDLDTVKVTVNPKPDAGFTYTSNCGREFNFTNTSTTASGSLTSYCWNFGTGNNNCNSTSASPRFVFPKNRNSTNVTYSVRLIVTNNTGCIDTVTQTVTVNPTPSAELKSDQQTTTINGEKYFYICASGSSSLTFYNDSKNFNSTSVYKINWGDASPIETYDQSSFPAPITSGITKSHTFTPGTYNLTFVILNGSCSDTVVYKAFVGSVPAGSFGSGISSTICTGSSETVIISGTNANTTGTVYNLTFNDQGLPAPIQTFVHPISDPFVVSHIFDQTSCGTNTSTGGGNSINAYGAFLTIQNPCGTRQLAFAPIYVAQKPESDFSISPFDTICTGQSVTITNTGTPGKDVDPATGLCTDGKFVWQITPNTPGSRFSLISGVTGAIITNQVDNWTPGSNSITIRFDSAGNYTVRQISSNTATCSGKDTMTKTICVNPIPTAKFIPSKDSGCTPLDVDIVGLTNTATCGQNTFQYSIRYVSPTDCDDRTGDYSFRDGTTLTSQNPKLKLISPGLYIIDLITISPKARCSSTVYKDTIKVKAPPTASISLPKDSVCPKETITPFFTYSCYVQNATFSWSIPGGSTTSPLNTATPPTVSYSPANTDIVNTYTISVTVTNDCGSVTASVPISVKPIPRIPDRKDSICTGNAFTLSPVTTPPSIFAPGGTTYTWPVPSITNGVSGSISGSILPFFNSGTLNNSGATEQFVVFDITPSYKGCAGRTFKDTIRVKPEATIQNTSTVICSGSTFVISPTNGGGNIVPAGTKYTWVVTNNPRVSGESNQSVSQINISQTLTNDTSTVQIVSYRVTPVTNGCPGDPFIVDVTVKPRPKIPNQSTTICDDAPLNFSPTNNPPTTLVPANTTYTWVITTANTNIGGASNQTTPQNSIQQPLVNNSNTAQTIVYTVTPKFDSCEGPSFTLSVTLNAKPVIFNQTTTICSGASFSVTPANGVPSATTIVPSGTTYTWTVVDNPNVTGESNQPTGQTSTSQTLTNTTNISQTVEYTVTPRSGTTGNCVGPTFKITVTVNPKPVIPIQRATICSGETFTITPLNNQPNASTIVPANTTYTWAVTSNANIEGESSVTTPQTNISQALTNTQPTAQTVTYTVTPTSGAAGACPGAAFTTEVIVNPKPKIRDTVFTYCGTGTLNLTPVNNLPAQIVPSGTTYTWNVTDNANVTGEVSQTTPQNNINQSLTNISNSVQTITYTVTPKSGDCTGQTFTITVKLNPKPFIANIDKTICSGQSFNATPLNGSPAGNIVPAGTLFSWTVSSNTNVTGQSNQNGQSSISQTLTINSGVTTDQQLTYTVTPKGSAADGGCVGSSFTVTVTIKPQPGLSSIDTFVCSELPITITPRNTPAGTSYTWATPTVSPSGTVTGATAQASPGVASITQTLTNTSNATATVTYDVIPSSGACGGSGFPLNIRVYPKPKIPAQTLETCSGVVFNLNLTNTPPGIILPANTKYKWTVTPNANVTGESDQSTLQASVSQTLINTTNIQQTVTYSVTPVSGTDGSCEGSAFTLTVKVNPKPTLGPQTASICSGNALNVAPAVSSSPDLVPAGTLYSWTFTDNTNVSGESNQTTPQSSITQTLSNPTSNNQDVVYQVTPVSGTCTGSSFNLTVSVKPNPSIQNYTRVVCSGDAFTVTPANGVPSSSTIVPTGTNYTWTVISNTDVDGESNESTPKTSISQTLTNNTNITQTVTYTVTPKSGDCVGATFTVTVTVNPKPKIANKTAVICSEQAFTVTPINSQPTEIVPTNITYTWTVASNTNVTGQSDQTATQTSISQTLTNKTNISQTVTYTVTPKSGDCTGPTFTVTVTVNPKPKISNQTKTICSETAFTAASSNGGSDIVPTNTLYTWTVAPNTNVTGQTNQTTLQTNISQTLNNLTTIPQDVVYNVTPKSGDCTGSTFTVTVTVNPAPIIPAQFTSGCSGALITFTPNTGNPVIPTDTKYTWTFTDNTNVSGETNQSTQVSTFTQTLTNNASTDQSVTYQVTPTSGATGNCPGKAFTLTVTLTAKPDVPDQTIEPCSGVPFTLPLVNNPPTTIIPVGTTYTWVFTDNANVTGETNQPTATGSVTQTLINTTNTDQTVVYQVSPGLGTSCSSDPFTMTVKVKPGPSIQNYTREICSGTSFSVTPSNGAPSASTIVPTGTKYTWTVASNSNVTGQSDQSAPQTTISQSLTNNTNIVQTVVYTVKPKSGDCEGLPFTITVTVNPKPVVPAQEQTICSGDPFTLTLTNNPTATIIPANTSYTWGINTNNNVTGQSAVTTGTTTISQTLTNNTNTQQSVVYNILPKSGAQGACEGSSFVLTVKVDPRPKIAAKQQTICSRGTFTETPSNISPDIVPLNTLYTWTVAPNTNVTGQTNQTTPQSNISQTLKNLTTDPQDVVYTVIPKSGNCEGPSFTLTIKVNPEPIIPDQSASSCSGSLLTVNFTNGVPNASTVIPNNTSYTWTFTDNTNVAGETNQTTGVSSFTQTLTNNTDVNQSVEYSITPKSGAAGNCPGLPFKLTVTLQTKPVVPNQSIETCSGVPFTLPLVNNPPTTIIPSGTTYIWSFTENTNVTGETTQTTPTGSVTQTLTNTTNTDQTVTYQVTPGLGTSCSSDPFTMTVKVKPGPSIQNYTREICSGTSFSVTPSNGAPSASTIVPTGTKYTWTVASNSNVTGQSDQSAPQTTISQSLTNNTNIVQTVVYTVKPKSGDCEGLPFTITVTVNPKPVVPAQEQTICSGDPFTLTLTNNPTATIIPANTSYTWGINTNNNVTGQSAVTTGTTTISQTLTNNTNTQQSVVYNIIPKSGAQGACEGSSFVLTVKVNPRPKIADKIKTICSRETFTIAPINNQPGEIVPSGIEYTWTVAPNTNVTGQTNQTTPQSNISQTLKNLTTVPQDVVYTVIPKSGNCEGLSFKVTITVNPEPIIPDRTTSTCSGVPLTVTFTNGVPNASTVIPNNTKYTWVFLDNSNVTGESIQATGVSTFTQTLTNLTSVDESVVYTITPTSGADGNCPGIPFKLTVNLQAKPKIPDQTRTNCSGDFTLLLSNAPPNTIIPSGTNYTWTFTDNTSVNGETAQPTPVSSVTQNLVNTTNVDQLVEYQITPVLGTTCTADPFTLKLTLKPGPSIDDYTSEICSGTSFSITPSNGAPTASTIVPADTKYTWTVTPNTNVIGWSDQLTPQTSISQALTNNTNIVQTVVYTVKPKSGDCEGSTFSVTVTVNPTPKIAPKTETICSGNSFRTIPVNNAPIEIVPSNTLYTWQVVVNNNVDGESDVTTGINEISQTLTNNTNEAQTIKYNVTPKSGTCFGSVFAIDVKVNPRPKIAEKTTTICSGEVFTVAPSNNQPTEIVPTNTQYTWTVVQNSNVGGESDQSIPQSNISQRLKNLTTTPQVVAYNVIPKSGDCEGDPFIVKVTVNPAPYIPNQTTTTCSQIEFDATPTNGVPDDSTIIPASTTYTWTVAPNLNVSGESDQSIPQSLIKQTLTNNVNTNQDVVYTVTPKSGAAGGCKGPAFTVTVTLQTKPVIPAQNTITCSGIDFVVEPRNNIPDANTIVPLGTQYTWTVIPNNNVTGESDETTPRSNISQNLVNITNAEQTVEYRVTPKIGNCDGTPFTLKVKVTPAPFILDKTSTICSGDQFTIQPTNNPPFEIVPTDITYTWIVASNTNVTGQSNQSTPQTLISQTLTNNTNVVQTVEYTVTPKSGNCTGLAFDIIVTVNPKPVVPTQEQTICSGNAFILTLVNNPTTTIIPLNTSYTWGLPTNTNVTGQSAVTVGTTTISQTLTNQTNVQQLVVYTITPKSGDQGSCVGSDFQFTLKVNPRPKIADKTTTICSGDVFTVAPSNSQPAEIVPSNTQYTWTVVTNSNVGGESDQSTPQSNISQRLKNLTINPQVVEYRVIPKSGDCEGDPFTVKVTVNPAPYIPNQTTSTCSQIEFDATPTNGVPDDSTIVPSGTTYTWTVVDNPNVSGESNQTTTPQSFIKQTLTNNVNTNQVVVYTVTPKSGSFGNCPGNPFELKVTLQTKPVIFDKTKTTCSGIAFVVSPTNGDPTTSTIVPAGTQYTWVVTDNTNVTGDLTETNPQSNISQTLINLTNQVQTVEYVVTPTIGNCTGSSFRLTVTVNPSPLVQNQTRQICSGTAFDISPSNIPPDYIVPIGTTYTWTVIDNLNVTGDVSETTPRPNINQTLTNLTNQVQTVNYTITPKFGVCVGPTFTGTIEVNPVPLIPNKQINFCSGNVFNFSPVNDQPTTIVPQNTTYEWTISVNGNVTGQSASTSPQTAINQTLTNNSNAPQVITYTITATSGVQGNCVGIPTVYTITVNPAPVFPTMYDTICSGSTFDTIPRNNPPGFIVPAGTLYTWTIPNMPSGPGAAPGSGTSGGVAQTDQSNIFGTLSNTAYLPLNVTYSVVPRSANPSGNACAGAPFNYIVTVNPLPVISNLPLIQSLCDSTNSVEVVFTTNTNNPEANPTYTWGPFLNAPNNNQLNSGTGNIPSMFLINGGDRQDTIIYPVITKANGCFGPPVNDTILVNPDAQARYVYVVDTACWPFVIQITNTSPETADSAYYWFADNTPIGTGYTFPGYTLVNPDDSVRIRLITISKYGCREDTLDHWFFTYNKPYPEFTMTYSNPPCGPLNVQFTNLTMNNTPRPMSPFQYEWNFGNGNTYTGANPPDEVYQANPNFTDTTYYVRLKVFNQCDTVTILDSVTVKAPPRAQFAPSQTNACSNTEIIFTNTSRGIDNSYEWNFGDGTPIVRTSNNNAVGHVFNTGVDTVFKVVLIATNECGRDVDTVEVRITPSYINLAWYILYNTQFGCVPHQVVIQNVSTGGIQFDWDYGDGFTETTRDNNDTLYHTYTAPGNYTINVRASNACTDTSGTFDVRAIRTPIPEFTIVNDYACPGTAVSFQNQTDTATTYLWNFDDPTSGLNNTSPAVNPTHVFLEPGAYDVTLQAILTDITGVSCPATVTHIVHVVAPEVRIIPDSPACIRDTMRFIAVLNTPAGLAPIRDTIWKINGVTYPIPRTTYPQFSHVFTQPGNYTITLIVGTTTDCYDTTSVTIQVHGIPEITAINDQRICLGNSVQLTSNSSVGNYQWNPSPNSGLSCYTCPNPIASPIVTTEYIVSTVNVEGCRNRDTVLVTVIQPFTLTVQPIADTICVGDTVRLIANGASTYLWSPSNTLSCSTCFNPIASPRSTTVYEVVGKDLFNCFTRTATVEIAVGNYPIITMPPNQVLATGTNYTIFPTFVNGPIWKYQWTPPINMDCYACATPTATVRKDVCYELRAENQYHCADTATFCIRAFCENSQVFIPNTFTPTASTNNIFRVRGSGVKTIRSFRVFNRWGELVYERSNISPNGEGWDGRIRGVMANSDVYIYTAEVLCDNDVPFTYKGNVTLIR